MENLKQKRRGYILNEKEAICLKCGYELSYIKEWENYYCNHYCCSPCCPDINKTPCSKETIEKLQRKMKDHIKEKMCLINPIKKDTMKLNNFRG